MKSLSSLGGHLGPHQLKRVRLRRDITERLAIHDIGVFLRVGKVGDRADPVGGRQLLVAALLDVAPLLVDRLLIDDKLDSAVTVEDADDDLGDRDRIRNDDQGIS